MINFISGNQINAIEIKCPLKNGNENYNHIITIKKKPRLNQIK